MHLQQQKHKNIAGTITPTHIPNIAKEDRPGSGTVKDSHYY